MRRTSTAVLSTVLLFIMLAAAVLWGAYRGWQQERTQVEQSIQGLHEMLSARREVAHNVLTVADRHLPKDDALVAALRQDTQAMARRNTLSQSAALNARVERQAREVLQALSQLTTVREDDRDLMYVSAMLPQALEQTAKLTEQAAYNQLAEDYNTRKARSLSGRLAGMLGVQDAELFVQLEGVP